MPFFLRERFKTEFLQFLQQAAIEYDTQCGGSLFLLAKHNLIILLVSTEDFSSAPASFAQLQKRAEEFLKSAAYNDILYLYEDRWYADPHIRERLLARLGRFISIFARKCKILTDNTIKATPHLTEKIDQFLNEYHSYGSAKSKYRFALEHESEIVAVATFSFGRKILRDTPHGRVEYNSYEWIRYASLPGCRVTGGASRLLKAFINYLRSASVSPIEIMSYADLEWSSGALYKELGFSAVSAREPIVYYVMPGSYKRYSLRQAALAGINCAEARKITNLGSIKYLLQL